MIQSFKELANTIVNGVIKTQKKIAILDFTIERAVEIDAFGPFIAEGMELELNQTGCFETLERSQLVNILKEKSLEMSDLYRAETVKKLGYFEGVDSLLIGTYWDYDNDVKVIAKLIDVTTAKQIFNAQTYIPKAAIPGKYRAFTGSRYNPLGDVTVTVETKQPFPNSRHPAKPLPQEAAKVHTSKYLSGTINETTILQARYSPYIVLADVTVPKSFTLIIEPGTIVKFYEDKSLIIQGRLLARGTRDNFIIFTKTQERNWKGIQFKNASIPFFGIKLNEDCSINRVLRGSPAEQAGLRTGDKITGINDS